MAVLEQAQADLPRREFLPGRGGAELFEAEGVADGDFFPSAPLTHYTLDAQLASIAINGPATSLLRGSVVAASSGVFAASSGVFAASSGVFAATAQSVAVARNSALVASGTTFTVTGGPTVAANVR